MYEVGIVREEVSITVADPAPIKGLGNIGDDGCGTGCTTFDAASQESLEEVADPSLSMEMAMGVMEKYETLFMCDLSYTVNCRRSRFGESDEEKREPNTYIVSPCWNAARQIEVKMFDGTSGLST